MRFPLTPDQALILVKLINNERILMREMNPFDMVALTQGGAIKRTNNENKNRGLTITQAGKRRFVKWARKEGLVVPA